MAFPTTRWTLVRAARAPEVRQRALDALLGMYWQPVYAYLRRRGLGPEDAEEVVQELFAGLLAPGALDRPDPTRGRLRSWLCGAAEHTLAHRREAERAQKRGGGAATVPLDTAGIEAWLADTTASPEEAFHRAWADGVLQRALAALRAEHADRAAILDAVFASPEVPAYRDLAAAHGMGVPQLKSFVFRARGRLRELALTEVRETVSAPDDAERELTELLGAG